MKYCYTHGQADEAHPCTGCNPPEQDRDGDPNGPEAQGAHLEAMAGDLKDVALAVTALGETISATEYLGATDTAEVLREVRKARKALADLEAIMESQVVRKAEAEGRREFALSDGSVVQFRGGTDRKDWDHRGLAYAVVRAVQVDQSTGEVLSTEQVVDRLLDTAAVSYWRVGALKPLGVQPNDYCTTSKGRRTIQFTDPEA